MQRNHTQDRYLVSMKNILYSFLIIIITFSCKEDKSNSNLDKMGNQYPEGSIFNITYRNHSEIEFLKDYKENAGSLVATGVNEYRLALSEIQNKNKRIILLEKIIDEGKPKKKFKIVDTLNINNLKEDEFILFGECGRTEIPNRGIIAILKGNVNNAELESFTDVQKAWEVNIKTEKMELLTDLSGIRCANSAYGI